MYTCIRIQTSQQPGQHSFFHTILYIITSLVTQMVKLESSLDSKEIKPVNPKGNQSWICIGRTDAEAEALILWPPDAKNWLIGKTLMLERIEGRRRRGQQDEMVGWHHWLNGRVWASSGSWWWTEKPGMLQSMESQRAGHDLATELTDWTVAHQAPLSMKFSRQEHWSGLPFPLSRGSSRPRDQTRVSCVSCIGRWILYH